MDKTTGSGHPLLKSLLTGFVMAMLMSATAFAATTPPIRSGTYKTPTRSGYEFQGWYDADDPDKTIVIDKNGNWLVDFSEDTRVKAKWSQPPTILIDGQALNSKLKKLSGQSPASPTTFNSTITEFKKSASAPGPSARTADNIISTTNSAYPVYAWFDNGTIWWYSDADDGTIYLNPNSIQIFKRLRGLTSVDLSMFDISEVTGFSGLFDGCTVLENVNFSGWDTSNVTSMSSMFADCSALTDLDISNFDTSNVTDMYSIFYNCKFTNLNISGLDTSKVTRMDEMFYGCSKVTLLDISEWDTSKVTGMNSMFKGCAKLNSLDLSEWDTSKVTNMGSMFSGCSSLTGLDVSGFNTSNVTSMSSNVKRRKFSVMISDFIDDIDFIATDFNFPT